jgi:hypothetical protein
MRKDMGNVDTSVGEKEALRTFIKVEDWWQIDRMLRRG